MATESKTCGRSALTPPETHPRGVGAPHPLLLQAAAWGGLALSVLLAPAAGAASAPVAKEALLAQASAAETELRTNILPFWLKYARDREHGGFHAYIGEDLKPFDRLPRGALLTSRILWTFSAVYRRYHEPEYLEMARWAYRDQRERFRDPQFGGLYWSVGADGKPDDDHKQIYGQVFGVYGLAEYYRATHEQPALDEAIALYRLVEKHAADPVHGGYFDALDRQWRRLSGPETNLLGEAPKSQNSHIHILEAYTNLLRVWPDPGLKERQRALVELTLARIIDARTHHLVLFMRDDWTPIGGDVSYGHDIELSWLLVEAAEVLGDPGLIARARAEALAIAKVTDEQGIDRDGGVYMEGNAGGPTDTRKEWWEQAEAVVGFLNAYQISGDARNFDHALRSWKFIQDKFVDRRHGDWYEEVERDGTPLLELKARDGRTFPAAKLSVWKCPYHNSRCCLEQIERLRALAGEPESP